MLEIRLNELYETFGYRKFKMSKFEPYDLYADNRDFLKSSQLITFTDLDGSLLALKPDVTLSIVKSSSGRADKVYYNETVYRPRDNHYREILQAGVECIGSIDSYAEAEVIALAVRSMGIASDRFVLRISDAAFLSQLFSSMELGESTVHEVLRLLSMKNASGLENLVKEGRITEASARTLRGLMELYLPFGEGVRELRRFAFSNTSLRMAEHLEEIARILESFGVLEHCFLDFSLINSMDYYNGIIFQGACEGLPSTVLSGGRYDALPQKMGKEAGAIGFAMNLDAVENYLSQRKTWDVDVLLLYSRQDPPEQVAEAVRKLTGRGKTVRTVQEREQDSMERRIRARETFLLQELLEAEHNTEAEHTAEGEHTGQTEQTAEGKHTADSEHIDKAEQSGHMEGTGKTGDGI